MLTRLEHTAMVLLFPVGLAGLAVLAIRKRPAWWLLVLWAIPSLILYTAYYWAPKGEGMGYVRFFISIFPPLIIGALGLLQVAVRARGPRIALLGLFVLLVSTTAMHRSIEVFDGYLQRYTLHKRTTDAIADYLPTDAAILTSNGFSNFIEFFGDYRLYNHETFDRGAIQRRMRVLQLEQAEPNPFQRERAERLAQLVGNKTNTQLLKLQRAFMRDLTADGHAVGLIANEWQLRHWRGRIGNEYQFLLRSGWNEQRTDRRGNLQVIDYALYEVLPRDGAPSPGEIDALETRVDMIVGQVKRLRQDFDTDYPGAREEWKTITDLERERRDLQNQLKQLKQKARAAGQK
jgi:hypothetical protein